MIKQLSKFCVHSTGGVRGTSGTVVEKYFHKYDKSILLLRDICDEGFVEKIHSRMEWT